MGIQDQVVAIAPLEENRIVRIKERMRKNLDDFIQTERIDENRFEQEIIYYLERIDITEERCGLPSIAPTFWNNWTVKTRRWAKFWLSLPGDGKEINTHGAKAQDPELQQVVVQMKDELEKIKEQLANIL